MSMHDGNHPPPCADCAIARWHARPRRLAARYRASVRNVGELFAMIGVVMGMDRNRLRRRWRALPERVRLSNYASALARDYRHDLPRLEKLIGELEGTFAK